MRQFFILAAMLSALPAGATTVPDRPGTFWLKLDALPRAAEPPAPAPAGEQVFASLSDLTAHALAHRPETRAIWLAALADAAGVEAVAATRWPELTARFSASRSQALASSGASVPALTRYGPNLSLSWVLFDFGAREAGLDAARARLLARLYGNDRALQDIVSEVSRTWFALAAARERVRAAEARVKAQDTVLAAARTRERSGLASRADVLRAEAALAEARRIARTAERDVAVAEAALRRAAGMPQGASTRFDITLPADTRDDLGALDALVERARTLRPDLAAALAETRAAQAEARRAQAARLPTVSLDAQTGRTLFAGADRPASNTYSVGVNLAVPLFDAGRAASEARAAARTAEAAEARLAVLGATVEAEVAQALAEARLRADLRREVEAEVASATESARAAEARYRAGVGSLVEWQSALADLARAREAQASADTDWFAALAALDHAVGRIGHDTLERLP